MGGKGSLGLSGGRLGGTRLCRGRDGSREGDPEGGLGCLGMMWKLAGLGWRILEWDGGEARVKGEAGQVPGRPKWGSHLLAGGGEPLGLLDRGLRGRLEGGLLGAHKGSGIQVEERKNLGRSSCGDRSCCLDDREGGVPFERQLVLAAPARQPDTSPALPAQPLVSHGVQSLLTFPTPKTRSSLLQPSCLLWAAGARVVAD